MTSTVDLDAYFERTGWHGEATPSFETLAGLLDAHIARIPFENLDVLLKRAIRLDLASVQAKLVQACRGGYCFEHVTLFAAVLERLGFHPVRHSARVTLLRPRSESPRTHMFLTVAVAGRSYVVDPGFGAMAPRAPLPLAEGAPVRVGDDLHEMRRDGHAWIMHAQNEDKAADAWVSTLEHDNAADFELANHYTSTHPSSPFVNNLMLRAFTPDGRVTLFNRDLTIWRGRTPHAIQLDDRAAVRAAVAANFGFDLPELDSIKVPGVPQWN